MSAGTRSKPVGVALENLAEATAACMFSMVQGNLAAAGISHMVIASQTGLLTALIAGVGLIVARTKRPWIVALQLGIATTVADFIVHYYVLGSSSWESLGTGIVAVILYLGVGSISALSRWKILKINSPTKT